MSKAFGAASILIGQSTSLTFTVTNPNPTFTTLTSLSFADGLPGRLMVASPNGLEHLRGQLLRSPGSAIVSMGNVTLAPGASCTWKVDVIATSAGTKNNTTNHISSTESRRKPGLGIDRRAAPSPPILSKAFGAASIPGRPVDVADVHDHQSEPDVHHAHQCQLLRQPPQPADSGDAERAIRHLRRQLLRFPGEHHRFDGQRDPCAGGVVHVEVDVRATSAGTKNNTTGIIASESATVARPRLPSK